MNDDTISRKSVIDAVHTAMYGFICGAEDGDEMTDADKLVLSINKAVCNAIKALPSVQPEESSEIQDILEYLDTVLHPIISPDYWNVYSELHDMISMLPSAQPEHLVKESGNLVNGLVNDCISRQAAKNKKVYSEERHEYVVPVAEIDWLPSAQPEAKHPKWVAEDRFIKNHFSAYPHCPQCNAEVITGDCYCRICGQHIDWSEDDE